MQVLGDLPHFSIGLTADRRDSGDGGARLMIAFFARGNGRSVPVTEPAIPMLCLCVQPGLCWAGEPPDARNSLYSPAWQSLPVAGFANPLPWPVSAEFGTGAFN